jgi:hypothetical protein
MQIFRTKGTLVRKLRTKVPLEHKSCTKVRCGATAVIVVVTSELGSPAWLNARTTAQSNCVQ